MAIAAVFTGGGLTRDKYDEVVGLAGPAVWDQPARSHHVCFETEHRGVGSDHVATVGEIYAALGRGDVLAIPDRLSEDVDWETGVDRWARGAMAAPGAGPGHVASFFEALGALDIKRCEPRIIVGGGDTVFARCHIEAVVSATGGVIDDDHEVNVWTFGPDGLATAVRHVVDTAMQVRALQG